MKEAEAMPPAEGMVQFSVLAESPMVRSQASPELSKILTLAIL